MQRFQTEYENLYNAFKKSVENESKMRGHIEKLNGTIMNNASRVKAAMRLTQEDAATIELLKTEVDRAWKLVETAKVKEEKAREIIEGLRNEIAQLKEAPTTEGENAQ